MITIKGILEEENRTNAMQSRGSWDKEVFWTLYNKPFLEKAFQRGDDIRLVSDPSVYQPDLIKGGTYKRELDEITKSGGLAEKYNYSYVPSKNAYIKN